MKSKIPKELLKLLKKRADVAEQLNSLDSNVGKILEDLNMVEIPEYITLQNEFGCMMTTEPLNYYCMVVDFIEKHLNKDH